MTRDGARYYLAGIIDGEGHVCLRKRGRTRETWDRRVEITTTDRGILQATLTALELVGVTSPRVYDRQGTNLRAYSICIYGRENYAVLATLPLKSAKLERLQLLAESYLPRRIARDRAEALVVEHGSERAAARASGIARTTLQYARRGL